MWLAAVPLPGPPLRPRGRAAGSRHNSSPPPTYRADVGGWQLPVSSRRVLRAAPSGSYYVKRHTTSGKPPVSLEGLGKRTNKHSRGLGGPHGPAAGAPQPFTIDDVKFRPVSPDLTLYRAEVCTKPAWHGRPVMHRS